MALLIANLAYLLALACYLGALILALEWLVHFLPGSALIPIRRFLFLISFPLLRLNDALLPLKWGSFNSRGLSTAVVLLIAARYGVPWLVLVSFSLRG